MGIDLKMLRRIGSTPPKAFVPDDEHVLVLVKLVSGASAPEYLHIRSEFGPDIVSAEVYGRDLARLGNDPAVLSVQRSEPLQLVR